MKKPEEKDLCYVRKLWADDITMKEVGGPIFMDEKKFLDWHKKMESKAKTDCYRLIAVSEKKFVGEASFHRFSSSEKTAHLNIKVEHSCRGRGYARAALREILRIFFEEWSGETMLDDVREDNDLALNFLSENGFCVSSEKHENGARRLFMTKKMYSDMICR
ncbi:GNAT family N-acetyltransferase [candidate division WOR-3 bacterium]|nr:GNAT family N-acetyltransferase [candidate division WOR-3 bacterium]